MIRMSRWRRWSVVAMLAVSPVLGALGCGYPCSAVGCLEGLNVLLSGGFDPDRTYTIELSRLTAAGASPVMTCARTWPSTGTAHGNPQMSCTSSLRFQADPWRIEIFDQSISELRVSISVDGAIVGQQDFSVRFTSTEDCGTCTTASVDVPFPARPLWGTQGESVFVNCGSDDLGATSFTATRDQLSSEQLQLLSAMQEVPNPALSPCRPTGDMDCFMRVTYDDYSVADHWARPSDEICDSPNREKLVSFATFDPFRQTLGCWYSKQLTAAAIDAAAVGGALPTLSPSAVCQHGIVTTAGTTISVGLDVLDGAAHHIALHQCNLVADQGQIELQLFDPTGSALLARSAAPTTPVDPDDGTCQAIDFTFPAAGTYVLEMVVPPSYEPTTAFLSYE